MRKIWKVAALMVVASGSGIIGKPAMAQDTGVTPVRAKLGVFLPQGDAREFAGSTHFNGEVDVAIPALGLGRTLVTAGYYQGSEDGRKLRMIPVTIAKVFSPPNPVGSVTGNVYFGLGAGAYFLRASDDDGSENKVRPGGFAMVGYQFPNPYFVEAKYHIVGSINGISPRGLAVMVGRRF